jgi:cytochrome b6-f complex iron-sulfur subunit
MSQLPTYGAVSGPPVGEMTRRVFMRRLIGWGVGLLSLEFLAGTFAFTWPNVRGGLGGKVILGSAADIAAAVPEWVSGQPFSYQKARIFLINVPAAKALVEGTGEKVDDPKDQVLALYRKCPHLGCQIPALCEQSNWFECLCHGSKYTILGEKRFGPAPRGMDRFPFTIEGGVYVADTGKLEDGPPIGTDTFDHRTINDMPHCAA